MTFVVRQKTSDAVLRYMRQHLSIQIYIGPGWYWSNNDSESLKREYRWRYCIFEYTNNVIWVLIMPTDFY